ncbi:MAG: Ig-like domain-containing protein [Spirochaetales bacterium]|nr:Ig-like domain-containing protein [Spirochaetales bacterium]
MMRISLFCILAASIMTISCSSCSPIEDLRDFSGTDLFPPVIEGISPINERSISLQFNENINIDSAPIITPAVGEITIENKGSNLILNFSSNLNAGTHYVIEATVEDESRNSMKFMMPFYGYNSNIPNILINEFTTQGSAKHPDVVELLVQEGGNLAGLFLVEGTTDYIEDSFTFPSCEVSAGDFILIHFKPKGIAEEIDETTSELSISEGFDASDTARDFWVEGGNGLGGNNGTICLYSFPGGELIDAVLYSNRTSSSDEKYSGFGSTKMLNKSIQIQEEGGWNSLSDNLKLSPEDAINPEDSTATRSICRTPGAADTNSATDWHITPTSGYSFGYNNTEEIYVPK